MTAKLSSPNSDNLNQSMTSSGSCLDIKNQWRAPFNALNSRNIYSMSVVTFCKLWTVLVTGQRHQGSNVRFNNILISYFPKAIYGCWKQLIISICLLLLNVEITTLLEVCNYVSSYITIFIQLLKSYSGTTAEKQLLAISGTIYLLCIVPAK